MCDTSHLVATLCQPACIMRPTAERCKLMLLGMLCATVTTAAAVTPTAAVQQSKSQTPSLTQREAASAGQHLSARSEAAFSISSLHATPLVNGTAIFSSVTGNLTGIKLGLPATCYGQPCSPAACFPAATTSVRQHVNYVNVTATVKLERNYNVRPLRLCLF